MFQVAQMLEAAFDLSSDKERRETALNNLVVLTRERAGAEAMFKEGVVLKIAKLLKVEKGDETIIPAIRIVSELCKDNAPRVDTVLRDIGLPWILEMINGNSEDRVNAAQYLLQVNSHCFS